jgi:5-methylcytosine-specific restriction protein A
LALADVTTEAVLKSLLEFDRIGREEFLAKYGFGGARTYLLLYEGRTYDSKAIVGVAHGLATGRRLASRDFSGGDATVARLLTRLGFKVVRASNPDWTRDELILACDLVVDNGWHELRTNYPAVIELSRLLQALPLHPPHERGRNFRSPDAVSRKTGDLMSAYPGYAGKRTRGGAGDRWVIKDFMERPEEMKRLANAIRAAAAAGEFDGLPAVEGLELDDDEGVPEGRLLLRRYLDRERDQTIKRKKIEQVRRQGGNLACQVCAFDFGATYGARGEGYIECHHVVPLHVTGETKTRLADLILICANCHRMIHRGSPWLTPDELRACLGKTLTEA